MIKGTWEIQKRGLTFGDQKPGLQNTGENGDEVFSSIP